MAPYECRRATRYAIKYGADLDQDNGDRRLCFQTRQPAPTSR